MNINKTNIVVDIEENLRGVCTKIKKKGREILSTYDITPPQFEALLLLIKEEELTISEISSKMFLACSTITDLIDRMERNDLVVRVKDSKDRRIVRIKVLDKGHKLINEVLDVRRLYLEGVMKDFNMEIIESLNQNLKLMNKAMKL